MSTRERGAEKSTRPVSHTYIDIDNSKHNNIYNYTNAKCFWKYKNNSNTSSSSSMLSLKHMVRVNNYLELTQEHTNYTDADIGCYCHSIFLFDRQQNTQALVKGLETFES